MKEKLTIARKIILTAALAGVMTGSAAQAADPISGIWQTEPDDGAMAHVKIEPCGPAFCGTIVRTFKDGKEFKSDKVGKQLVRNMKPVGQGRYEGQVWRPSNDKIYSGKVELEGDNMNLRGCVVGGLICAKQVWTRLR